MIISLKLIDFSVDRKSFWIGNDNKLMDKNYSFLIELTTEMIRLDDDIRPDCGEILDQVNSWTLSKEDIQNSNEFEQIQQLNVDDKQKFIIEILMKKLNNQCDEKRHQYEVKKNKTSSKSGRFSEKFVEICPLSDGSNTVFKARNVADGEFYAVKQMKINRKNEFIDALFCEWKIISKLRRDFIIKYHSIWQEEISSDEEFNQTDEVYVNKKENTFLYIQMELCHKSLEDTLIQMEEEIKDGEIMISISYLVACELLKEILESVDYLHRQNPPIIHGKLNSKNILITLGMNGRFIKLSNFFSKLTEILDDTSDARENRRSKYIAREYEYGEYDTKADIYSLGVVINDLFSSFKKMYIIKKYYSNNPNNLNLTNLPKYYQVIELE
jgi:hypothetical protein